MSNLKECFDKLADEWMNDFETQITSSPTTAMEHPACQRIMLMGEMAVPFIIGRMRCDLAGAFWFEVLHELTGEDPIPKAHRGKVELMFEDWEHWWDAKQEQVED